MGTEDEAGRRGSAGGLPPVSGPDRAALEVQKVAGDIAAALGPVRPTPVRDRSQRAELRGPRRPAPAPRRRPLAALAAAALVGLVCGGAVVGGLMVAWPRAESPGAGLKAMLALSPPGDEAPRAAAPPAPARDPAPPSAPPAPPLAEAPSSRRLLSRAGAPSAPPPAPPSAPAAAPALVARLDDHDAAAALSALSQSPEVFYAKAPAPGTDGSRPGEACPGGDAHCVSQGAAVLADKRVRQAYAEAAAAGVSEAVLSGLRRSWADMRERLSERPADLVLEYGRLADALVRARDRARAQADEPDARPRGSSDR